MVNKDSKNNQPAKSFFGRLMKKGGRLPLSAGERLCDGSLNYFQFEGFYMLFNKCEFLRA
jgi:hypothetical protein